MKTTPEPLFEAQNIHSATLREWIPWLIVVYMILLFVYILYINVGRLCGRVLRRTDWFYFHSSLWILKHISDIEQWGKLEMFLIQIIKHIMPGTCTHYRIPGFHTAELCCRELAYVLCWSEFCMLCSWVCGIGNVWMNKSEENNVFVHLRHCVHNRLCVKGTQRLFGTLAYSPYPQS